MKKFTFIVFFALTTICTFGQNKPDQTQILQKCIDLPAIQLCFPADNDGGKKQICILQHGVSFPSNIEVSKFGKDVLLYDKSQLSAAGITSYFLFWEFKIDNNIAKVDFVYNFININMQAKMKKINLEFIKDKEVWTISSTKIEGE